MAMNVLYVSPPRERTWRSSVVACLIVLGLVCAACSYNPSSGAPAAAPTTPAGAKPAASGTVSVAMVGNPQMKTLAQLKGDFESSHPGITLNLLVLPEDQVRDKVTTDISTGAGQFD